MAELHPRRRRGFGWVPDLPDARDHLFATRPATVGALPASVDLRAQCPAQVYDQGRIGSCTANAIAGAFEFDLLKQQLADFMPSRLFIYYNERSIEGSVGTDSGAMIRDGMKSVATLGVCSEDDWKYDDTPPAHDGDPWPANARAGQKPTQQCYTDARRTQRCRISGSCGACPSSRAAWRRGTRSCSASPCTKASNPTPSPTPGWCRCRPRRTGPRRSRRPGRRLRRRDRPVPGPQLLGTRAGG